MLYALPSLITGGHDGCMDDASDEHMFILDLSSLLDHTQWTHAVLQHKLTHLLRPTPVTYMRPVSIASSDINRPVAVVFPRPYFLLSEEGF